MGNQHDPEDPKAQMKGGGSTGGQQKGQPPKAGTPGNDPLQQLQPGGDYATGGSGTAEHGRTRSYGTDQERAGDSGQKSHE